MKKVFTTITELLLKAGRALNKPVRDDLEQNQDVDTKSPEKPRQQSVSRPKPKLQRMSNEGKAMLTHLEGICLTKYLCSANVWTIGIGATGTEIKDIAKWPMNKEITIEEAFELLDKSLHRYERAVRKGLKVEVPQHAFDALVSWCYNVGIGWVPKATVIKLINKGVPISDRRVYNALMKYRKPKEIISRRRKEAKLLTKGRYSGNFRANLAPVNARGIPMYAMGEQIDLRKYLGGEPLPGGALDYEEGVAAALDSYRQHKKKVKNHDYKVVIQMQKHSKEKRFLILDKDNNIIQRHHTAHGVNTSCKNNRGMACHFSNVYGSRQSSLGAFITGNTYFGKYGLSLNLHGLEPQNDQAYKRRIVIHKAPYMRPSYIKSMGRAGQSWGCPALDPAVYKDVINLIKDGCFLYIYYKGL